MNDLAKIGLATAAGIVLDRTVLKGKKIPGLGGVRKKRRKTTAKRKTTKRKATKKKRG